MIKLRRDYPILRRSRFLSGDRDAELDIRDVVWINTSGAEMTHSDWTTGWIKCFAVLLDGRARKTAIARRGEDDTVLVILNSYEGEVDFKLPPTSAGRHWSLLLDTNAPEDEAGATLEFGSTCKVTGRSFVLLTAGEVKRS
jgi:glycogen operon protein